MKIAYFPNQVAFNGYEVLAAFLKSAKLHNYVPIENSLEADAAVIWSVLWNGRLSANKLVYEHYRNQKKPVFILEIGALRRGYTWKVSLNDITSNGIYGNIDNIDIKRPEKIGVYLQESKKAKNPAILFLCQHQKSHQWKDQAHIKDWLTENVKKIREYSNRPILIRPHPRSQFSFTIPGTSLVTPNKLSNAYEEYEIDYNYHCVINHNSGPSIIAPIKGTPVICDPSSLGWPVSGSIKDIETISLPDRKNWFLSICHTEWTIDEIENGYPLSRLVPYINS